MLVLKRNMLSVALTSALLAAAGGARAQAAADLDAAMALDGDNADAAEPQQRTDSASQVDQTLDEVVVTGIRAGIESAIEAKQEATSIVDVVSAEDLGKLPDISIADSIARLPGLAAQRVAGRASTISIRGLAGDYGTTLLNGREQVSVGDNRTVEFDQFPSELINQVMVYKTPTASLVGQGLSGTVDLRTVRPLSFFERTVSVNVRGERNSIGKLNSDSSATGSRVSAFYVDQFLEDRLGIALGYARLDSPGQSERWEAWGYPNDNGAAPGAFVLGGSKSMASSTDNVRQGFMGVLEYNASDTYSMLLDVYYSRFDKVETTRFLETGLGWSGAQLVNPVIENGVVVGGTFEGVRPVLRNDLNEGDDKLFAIGWNNRFEFGDAWAAELDLSHSRADRRESILETYAGTRAGITDNVDFRLDRTGPPSLHFGLDYTDPSAIVLTDPGGWGQDGYIKHPEIDDKLTSFRGDLERRFDSATFSSIEFGLNQSNREKSRSVDEAFVDLLTPETTIPSDLLLRPVDLSFTGVPGSISYRINPAFQRFYQLRPHLHPDVANKQWTVDEKVTTAYAQLNLDAQWGSVPVRGNLGVQAVRADQSSDGFIVVQGNAIAAEPFTGAAKYTHYLPNANLAFSLPAEQVLRVGLGRQMARPRVDQMRANNNTNLEFAGEFIGLWRRDGGNPELKPWIANAADVSWEKYFGNRGYVSLAYFYKDLKSFVFNQQTLFDATGLPIPDGYTGPTPFPVGIYTRPANGEGGSIHGWEANVSIPFDLFTPALEGFGLVANYSRTSSSIKPFGPEGPDEPIPGLSRGVRNITFYYENYGFQARISQRWRTSFVGEIQGFGADRENRFIDGESVLDLQTGYSFEHGALEGVSILLQVNNLTNEPYREYFGDSNLTRRYEKYGRQYLLGVTYRF